MTVYKSPAGDFHLFPNRLEVMIKKFFQSHLKLIICGDINVNYLIDTERKRQLDLILNCYNLFSTIHFSTRNQNEWSTAMDTIFIDTLAFTNFKIIPIIIHLPLSAHFLPLFNSVTNEDYSPLGKSYAYELTYIAMCLWRHHHYQKYMEVCKRVYFCCMRIMQVFVSPMLIVLLDLLVVCSCSYSN